MASFMTKLVNTLSFAEKKQEFGEVTEAKLQHWLVERLARQLKIDPSQVDSGRSFESYGLDSIVAVQVAGDLEKLLEQRLSPALLFEYQNIDALAHYLASEMALTEA